MAKKSNLVAHTTDTGIQIDKELRLASVVAMLMLSPSLYKETIMQTDSGANIPSYFPLPPMVKAFVETWLSGGGRDMAAGNTPKH